jgi:type VI secretion system protein ImpL
VKRFLFPALFLVISILIAWLVGPITHLHGGALILLRLAIIVVGIAAAIAVFFVQRGVVSKPTSEAEARDASELTTLIRDAQQKLVSSQRALAKSLDTTPLLYILGEANSAKTTTLLRSGLDPELLAGQVYRDKNVIPTTLATLSYTKNGILIEAGEALRESAHLWNTLVHKTQPRTYRSALGTRPPVRAAVVCTSCELFFGPDAAESLTASARKTNLMLRTLSRRLGTDVSVYVIFTKLDRIPGFAEFVRHLTTEEVTAPLGIALPYGSVTAGLYAEQATSTVSSALDQLFFSLSEFRVEALSRNSDEQSSAPVYEFPREMQKLRNNLASYLVELTRPSHLSANAYLRGFYFTGVRAHITEQAVSAPANVRRQQVENDADATRILSLKSIQAESGSVGPQVVTQKIAQWCFLPRLFSDAIFADHTVLSATGTSARVNLVRRIALGAASAALLLWFVGLGISYHNNAKLEHTIEESRIALASGPAFTTLAPTAQLASLDRLRLTLMQLETFDRQGAPFSFRWGLYRGHSLIAPARQVYFDIFARLLLVRTQKNLVATLGTLPDTAPANAEYSTAYNPLRAYLITTSYADKSTAQFLAPVLVQAWLNGQRPEGDEQTQLAQLHFSFYADELLIGNPYHFTPAMPTVAHARTYLNSFGGFDRIYQNLLAAANQASPPVDFNRLFPGSSSTVVDPHIVQGAFTRNGFTYMQKAMQHPDRYFSGEAWVLGDQAAPSLQTASLIQQLTARYSTDFAEQWRTFLHAAAVVRYRNLAEANQKLQSLSSPSSALLALMFTVSQNTAVADAAIAQEFQPTQTLVPPDSTNKLMSQGNQDYINGLIALQGAIAQFTQNPAAASNPDAAQPVMSAAVSAHGAVSQTAQAFNVDVHAHVEQTIISLLQAPISSVEDSVRGERPEQLNAAGRSFCSNFSAVASKYPFSRNATTEATPAEVTTLLKPGSGALWQFYDANLKTLITQQGTAWVATPNSTLKLTPAFLQFFNRAAALSASLFPSGAAELTLAFTAHILRSPEIKSVTLAVDAQRLTGADVSQQFTWSAQNAQQAELLANYGTGSLPLQFNGTWSLFHLIDHGKLEQASSPARLAYPLEISNTPILVKGTPLTERIEISGAGASLLIPGALSDLRCVSQVAH